MTNAIDGVLAGKLNRKSDPGQFGVKPLPIMAIGN
jgi:hypothetical protein